METAVYQNVNVRRAALVGHRGKRILAVEFHEGSDAVDLKALAWAHVDEVVKCKTIPVDKRHNAKIDYPALSRMLERRR